MSGIFEAPRDPDPAAVRPGLHQYPVRAVYHTARGSRESPVGPVGRPKCRVRNPYLERMTPWRSCSDCNRSCHQRHGRRRRHHHGARADPVPAGATGGSGRNRVGIRSCGQAGLFRCSCTGSRSTSWCLDTWWPGGAGPLARVRDSVAAQHPVATGAAVRGAGLDHRRDGRCEPVPSVAESVAPGTKGPVTLAAVSDVSHRRGSGFSSAGAGALGSLVLLAVTPMTAAQVVGTDLFFGLAVSLVGSSFQLSAGNCYGSEPML